MKTSPVIKLTAIRVPVLRFRRQPDRSGDVIPPECYCTFPKEVPVNFDGDDDSRIGWAVLKRSGNTLFAELHLWSTMTPPEEALNLIRRLVPSVNGVIKDCFENLITHFAVTSLTLGHSNADAGILPLGEKVYFAHGRKDLH